MIAPAQKAPEWTQLEAQLSHHPAQHMACRRLKAIAIGTRFKLRHLLSDTLRPDARGGAVLAAKAVIRRALKLGLICLADGVHGLVPYYEKVK